MNSGENMSTKQVKIAALFYTLTVQTWKQCRLRNSVSNWIDAPHVLISTIKLNTLRCDSSCFNWTSCQCQSWIHLIRWLSNPIFYSGTSWERLFGSKCSGSLLWLHWSGPQQVFKASLCSILSFLGFFLHTSTRPHHQACRYEEGTRKKTGRAIERVRQRLAENKWEGERNWKPWREIHNSLYESHPAHLGPLSWRGLQKEHLRCKLTLSVLNPFHSQSLVPIILFKSSSVCKYMQIIMRENDPVILRAGGMGGIWERKKKREDGIPQFPWKLKFPYSSFKVASLCSSNSVDRISHVITSFHSQVTEYTSPHRAARTSAQSMNSYFQTA